MGILVIVSLQNFPGRVLVFFCSYAVVSSGEKLVMVREVTLESYPGCDALD